MLMKFFFLIFVSSSSAWNCTIHPRSRPSSSIFSPRSMIDQCEIILEYQSIQDDEHVVCTTRSKPNETEFDSMFSSSLIHRTLRMISCSLSSFKSFSSSFEYVDLTNNSLTTFDFHQSNLKYLRLDENIRLKEIFFRNHFLLGLSVRFDVQLELTSLPSTLIELDLTGCQFDHLPSLISLKNLRWLSLAENRLEYLPQLDKNLPLIYLNLSFNRIFSIDSFEYSPPFSFIFDFQSNFIDCDSNLFCSYEKFCPDDCSCCEFEACDCHLICPSDCRCEHDRHWHQHRVRCRSTNRTDLNEIFLPNSIDELVFTDSPKLKRISQLELFLGQNQLKNVDFSRNDLETFDKTLFCLGKQIQQINLSENSKLKLNFSTLDDDFQCLNDLRSIVVSSDQIDLNERLPFGWTLDLHRSNSNLFQIRRTGRVFLQSSMFSSSTSFSSSHLTFLLCLLSILLLIFVCFSIILIFTVIPRRHHRQTRTEVNPSESLYEQLPSLISDVDQPFLPPALPPRLPFPCSTSTSGLVFLYGTCSSNVYHPMICTCSSFPKTSF